MTDYLAQALLHAAAAALVVEILLRVWQVVDVDFRIALRLLPLLFPLTVLPALLVLAPGRHTDAFREHRALFVATRWNEIAAFGVGVGQATIVLLVAAGTLLFVADMLAFARRRRDLGAAPTCPPTAEFRDEVAAAARASAVPTPAIRVLDGSAPAFSVAGVRVPALVVSRGALARLDDAQRRAALAHEMAHLAHRDALLGWGLMACRLLSFFNPIAQIAARTIVRELEWRADDSAVAVTGDRAALASALVIVASGEAEPPPRRRLARLFARGRADAMELRRARVLQGQCERVSLPVVRLVSAAAALGVLLFFVV